MNYKLIMRKDEKPNNHLEHTLTVTRRVVISLVTWEKLLNVSERQSLHLEHKQTCPAGVPFLSL